MLRITVRPGRQDDHLVLRLPNGESIRIEINPSDHDGRRLSVMFDCPKDIKILRQSVIDRMDAGDQVVS